MTESKIESLAYLRELSELVDNDPACTCCAWAADEIERLRSGWDGEIVIGTKFAKEAAEAKAEIERLKAELAGDPCPDCYEYQQEAERLKALAYDLVGEETLHQNGEYQTEIQKLRAEIERLRDERNEARQLARAWFQRLDDRLIDGAFEIERFPWLAAGCE